jgi:hypothetical protein
VALGDGVAVGVAVTVTGPMREKKIDPGSPSCGCVKKARKSWSVAARPT